MPTAIAITFIGNTAFVSTVQGVYSVDISDPKNPQVLTVGGPSPVQSAPGYIWENEHMQSDPKRNLVIIARDPRNFATIATTAFPYGAADIRSVGIPGTMVPVSFHRTPTGHTTTCINDCQYLWIAGPASPAVAVQGGADPTWGGRPMWGLDIRDPANPVDCPHFIDLNNHNGQTDYDHDVDVDADGVAWISGSGHIHGYWTSGQHWSGLDGKVETATPCDPIPYAGGNTNEGQIKVQGGVIHNSGRNLNISVDGRKGDVVAATEEVNDTDCTKSGRFLTYDVGNTYGAKGWIDPKLTLRKVGSWYPEKQPGSSGCDSAHWFADRGDGLIAIAFYSQGTRVLDIRDPYHIKNVAWYNVQDQTGTTTNNTWAAYWHGDNYIYVADVVRGLDILRYHESTPAAGVAGSSTTSAAAQGSGSPNTSAWRVPAWLPPALLAGGVVGALTALTRRRQPPVSYVAGPEEG